MCIRDSPSISQFTFPYPEVEVVNNPKFNDCCSFVHPADVNIELSTFSDNGLSCDPTQFITCHCNDYIFESQESIDTLSPICSLDDAVASQIIVKGSDIIDLSTLPFDILDGNLIITNCSILDSIVLIGMPRKVDSIVIRNNPSLTYISFSPPIEELDLSLIHISEPTRPRLISYAVFCLKKKKT